MGQIRSSDFRPAWWLPGAHLQTLWPTLARRRPDVPLTRRRIELQDGDFIDLSVHKSVHEGRRPGVLIVHGLEGGLASHYGASLMQRLASAGFGGIFMHLRGCSGEPNRLARSYHSGASDDLQQVLRQLADGPSGAPFAAIGISLGGNLLLKYLGEQVQTARSTPSQGLLQTAIAVSPPFVLRDAMLRLNHGFSRIYRTHLMRKLKHAFRRKFANRTPPLQVDLAVIADFNDFDEQITAPLCGFDGVFDYYNRASCRGYLRSISTPTLILHARDDPFLYPTSIPFQPELGPGVTLELSEQGGHVGFIAGTWPWQPRYWLEERILTHLNAVCQARVGNG